MLDYTPLVLALTAGEIISILIAIGVILSGIFGQVNEAKKAQRRRESKAGEGPPGEQGGATGLDEIAQRRRQQLEALAKQRRAGSSVRPDRALTTQAADRATSKAEYEAGAASMRELEAANPMLSRGEGGGVAQRGADADRAELHARHLGEEAQNARLAQQERQRRKQQSRQARQQGEQRRRRQAPPPLPADEPVQQSRHGEQLGMDVEGRRVALSDLGRGATTVDTSVHAGAYDSDEVHRHVEDVATVRDTHVKSRLAVMMGGRTWRDVFMLKEVLDPPLTMRQDQGPSDPFSV